METLTFRQPRLVAGWLFDLSDRRLSGLPLADIGHGPGQPGAACRIQRVHLGHADLARLDAHIDDAGEQQRIDLITAGVKYQYYLLWVTDPAEVDSGFGVAISDIRLFGTN